MKVKLDKGTFTELFQGFFIADCVVRKRDIIYFILEKTDEHDEDFPMTREIQCIDRAGMPTWGNQDFPGVQRMRAGVSYLPTEQFVGVSSQGYVYATGSGDAGQEDDLKGLRSRQLRAAAAGPDQYLLRGAIAKLRTIGGRVWGVGGGRTVLERRGKNDWHYHTTLPKDKTFLDPNGFEDIDGFSEHDVYAVGGNGDMWHFDGKQWQQVAFPSNMQLESVCCAGDGYVYIGAESGSVFKGRANQWKLIHRGSMALPFRDMVWHQNSVWCTSDHGLWVIRNDRVEDADVPDGVRVCAGNLSAADGVLLVAGGYGAALHDGSSWHRIVDYNKVR